MIPLSTARLLGCIDGLRSLHDDSPDLLVTDDGLAFINHVGFHSHLDEDTRVSTWPLPRGVGIDTLARFANRLGVLKAEPQVGDILLRRAENMTCFDTAGIITEVGAEVYRRGYPPGVRVRAFERTDAGVVGFYTYKTIVSPAAGDRFIRWVDLDPRHVAGNPRVVLDFTRDQILMRRVA